MAVQAQYPSNALFLHRGEQDMKPVDYSQVPAGNPRKRSREAAASAPQPQFAGGFSLFSLQPQVAPPPPPPPPPPPLPTTAMISLAQLQTQHPPPLVSTGLRLAFEDLNQTQTQSNPLASSSSSPPVISSLFADDLAATINRQRDEIDQFLLAQAEQLRREIAERRQRHLRALFATAEEAISRRLREKEAEVERAARQQAELEDRIARLQAESMAWKNKALCDQATAASLHAQLQQATVCSGAGETNEPAADDAESAHVDPGRVEPSIACRYCWARPMSMVLMPCRHLCLCPECDASVQQCPVCRTGRSGSISVLLS